MSTNKKVNSIQFDKRVMHRFVQSKKLSLADAEKHLKQLPDLAEQAEDISSKIYGDRKGHAA